MTARGPSAEQVNEQMVIGAMMAAPDTLEAITDKLTSASFADWRHSTLFAHITAAWAAGNPTEPTALVARIDAKELVKLGGVDYLHDCYRSAPAARQAGWYAGEVAKAAYGRILYEQAIRLQEVAKLNDPERRAELVHEIVGQLQNGNGHKSTAGRKLRLTRASEIQPEPVVWAWEDDGMGRIPSGTLTVGAGREGTGKSSMGIWLASQITRGTLPGAFLGRRLAVIYAAVEDSWKYTIVPRLIAAGADLTRVYRADVVIDETAETTLCLPADIAMLEETIVRHDVALVVLDPLMSTIGAGIDTHRERDTRTALDPLAQLADRTRCVVFGIAHFSKGSGTDPSSLITGSGAFKNVPRAIFGFAVDPESGESVMTQTKNSLGRHDLPSLAYRIVEAKVETKAGMASVGRFVIDGVSESSVSDILAGAGDAEDQTDAAAWLKSYLADNGGEAEAPDVFKAGEKNGYSKDGLKRAKKRAKVVSRKEGMDAGWMWVLADALPKGAKDAKGAKGGDSQEPPPSSPPSGTDPGEGSAKGAATQEPLPSLPSLPSRSSDTDNPGQKPRQQEGTTP